ncbi:hypothetical protein G647_08338 [Cladophialophora carrionii CBS 160.54]|uniref:Uncharacterized protein n=1 Tax=Cladophialophora carrionii CBS 160.54 TaxID=1279043 RepID=V9D069_9EURO|nr:uncharacterized protein G647_08338 [Cladophialophora carrionii CBS 160.54]ETI20304.1 hypothetical protein G647_08338 [Cladophialophora carrionii CBS 160.54]
MPDEQTSSVATAEEVSGWWPSDKSERSRLKAFFGRTKSEKFTRQYSTEPADALSVEHQALSPPEGSQCPAAVARQHHSNGDSTWPSRKLGLSRRSGRENRMLRAQKSLPNLFQLSSHPPAEELYLPPPVLLPPMPMPMPRRQQTAARNVSRPSTDSSVHTVNIPDHLRERSFSDNHSISTTHTSFSSHASYGPHTPDSSFSSTDSYEAQVPPDPRSRILALAQHDLEGPSVHFAIHQGAISKKCPVPLPRQTTSQDNPLNLSRTDSRIQKPLPAVPQLDDAGRRISTVAPLPEPGHIRKTSARYRCETRGGAYTEPSTPTSPGSRPCSIRSTTSSRTSGSCETHKRTASYSLFPRTPSSRQPDLPSRRTFSSPSATATGSTTGPQRGGEIDRERDRDRERGRASAVLDSASAPPSPPLTDPATTRERATSTGSRPPSRTKFKRRGMLPVDPRPRGASAREVPFSIWSGGKEEDGDDAAAAATATTATTIDQPPPLKVTKRPPARDQIIRQNSMPSLSVSARARSPPSGPPPDTPLPALPTGASRWVSLPAATLC